MIQTFNYLSKLAPQQLQDSQKFQAIHKRNKSASVGASDLSQQYRQEGESVRRRWTSKSASACEMVAGRMHSS
jgi:hypothetical protein